MDISLDLRPLLETGDEAVLEALVQTCVVHGAEVTYRGVPVLPLLLDAQRFAALNAIAQARPPGFYQVLRGGYGHSEMYRLWRRLAAEAEGQEGVYRPLIAWQELVTVMASGLDMTRIVEDWQFAPETLAVPASGRWPEVPWEFPEPLLARTLAARFERAGATPLNPVVQETMTRIAAQVSYQGRLPRTPITPASLTCAEAFLSEISHGRRHEESARAASFYNVRLVIPAKELVVVFYSAGGYEVVRNRAIAHGEGGPLFAAPPAPARPGWAGRAWF